MLAVWLPSESLERKRKLCWDKGAKDPRHQTETGEIWGNLWMETGTETAKNDTHWVRVQAAIEENKHTETRQEADLLHSIKITAFAQPNRPSAHASTGTTSHSRCVLALKWAYESLGKEDLISKDSIRLQLWPKSGARLQGKPSPRAARLPCTPFMPAACHCAPHLTVRGHTTGWRHSSLYGSYFKMQVSLHGSTSQGLKNS